MKVNEIIQKCSACPSQWEIELSDGRMAYARYRWGGLTIEVSKEKTNDIYMAMGEDGNLVYNERLGDEYDGVLGQDELIEQMKLCGFVF